ncbi:somatostatin receptor type 5-like [Anneissia japonica]|uniref:somatostatin receptor type 5-like n=1 Tax=Anneissia japonica TaxID=1529436 RepID=UPI0014259DD3|nr:somatostatin receptor type 5-like [Anneissia japonica]
MPGVINNGSYENVTRAELDDSSIKLWASYIKSISYTDLDKVIIPIIMPIVVSIGVIGNIMTIIVIASKKCMHTPVNVYFANLAIADTLLLITAPDLIWNSYLKSPLRDVTDNGEMMNWVCPLNKFLYFTVEQVAFFTIFWLSVERYMAICRPLKFRRSGFGNCLKSLKICGIIWFLCLSWSAPLLVLFRKKTKEVSWPLFAVDILPNFVTICTSRSEYIVILWYVNRAIIVLMIVIIVALYTAMLMSVRKSRSIAGSSAGTNPISKSELKVFLTVFVTITVYVGCLAPFQIYVVLLDHKITVNNSLINLFFLMVQINSSVNPVIYNAMNYRFRRAFYDVYCNRCNRKKNIPINVQI